MADEPLPAALYLDGQLGLVDDMLHYFDRASMAHSLEVRVPFLDHELVEFCAGIARRSKSAAEHEARPQARGSRTRPRPHHRQAEGRLLQRRRRLVAALAGAQCDLRPPPRSRPRYAELLDRKAVEQLVHRHTVEPRSGTETCCSRS